MTGTRTNAPSCSLHSYFITDCETCEALNDAEGANASRDHWKREWEELAAEFESFKEKLRAKLGSDGMAADVGAARIIITGKHPPDHYPNKTEREDFGWAGCYQCGENVCVNMYGMGTCRRCDAKLPGPSGNNPAKYGESS